MLTARQRQRKGFEEKQTHTKGAQKSENSQVSASEGRPRKLRLLNFPNPNPSPSAAEAEVVSPTYVLELVIVLCVT